MACRRHRRRHFSHRRGIVTENILILKNPQNFPNQIGFSPFPCFMGFHRSELANVVM
jgi:hypothetical protein